MEYQKSHRFGVLEAFKKGGVLKNECVSQSGPIISLLKDGATIQNLDKKYAPINKLREYFLANLDHIIVMLVTISNYRGLFDVYPVQSNCSSWSGLGALFDILREIKLIRGVSV